MVAASIIAQPDEAEARIRDHLGHQIAPSVIVDP
jgi:hypothetical protein